MVRKVTLSVKIQAKVNFEGMGAKPPFPELNNFTGPKRTVPCFELNRGNIKVMIKGV